MIKIYKLISNNKGTSAVGVILACIIIVFGTVLILEVFRYYSVKDSMDKELSRAVNIAIDIAMDDNKRKIHVSSIDEDIAAQEFYSYLIDELKLDDELIYDDGKLKYQLRLDNVNIQSDPPKFEVEGMIILRPEFFTDFIPFNIEIPVKAKARNQRMDED